ALVRLDGRPVHLMAPWQTRVFWKVATRVEAERIDVASDPKVAPRHLAMVARERNLLVAEHVVENHEAGLLYVEGRLVERLAPGVWGRGDRGGWQRGDGARREGRDPARRDPRAREQGGGGGADREGEPDPPPGGDRGDAFAPQHRQAHGGQPAPPAAQGARVARAAGGEGRKDRSPRRRGRGPRCAAEPARAPEGARDGVGAAEEEGPPGERRAFGFTRESGCYWH